MISFGWNLSQEEKTIDWFRLGILISSSSSQESQWASHYSGVGYPCVCWESVSRFIQHEAVSKNSKNTCEHHQPSMCPFHQLVVFLQGFSDGKVFLKHPNLYRLTHNKHITNTEQAHNYCSEVFWSKRVLVTQNHNRGLFLSSIGWIVFYTCLVPIIFSKIHEQLIGGKRWLERTRPALWDVFFFFSHDFLAYPWFVHLRNST